MSDRITNVIVAVCLVALGLTLVRAMLGMWGLY